jgi:hypothetical protein
MGAGDQDRLVGYDELGNAVMETVLGERYIPNPMASRAGMTMDEFWQQSNNLRQPQRDPTTPVNAMANVAGMLTNGVRTPYRALMGQPVTYGDLWDTAGTAVLGGSAMPKPAGAMGANSFRAYHGSPHSFDKFSMDKIGTGEGAQAYGHGLYFADSEGVAKNYRNNLSGNAQGTPYVADEVRGWVDSAGGDYSKAAQEARAFLKENGGQMDRDQVAELKNAIYLMDREKESFGSMYEVNINADPETFLDWDKPFASADDLERFAAKFDGVDPALRKRIEDYGYVRQQQGGPMPDGNDLLREVFGGVGEKASVRATETMREAGIPGIKYLDAGPRPPTYGPYVQDLISQAGSKEKALEIARQRLANAPDHRTQIKAQEAIDALSIPETRNYVVFDDSMIEILRKYGLAGLGVGGAAMMQPGQAQAKEKNALSNYLESVGMN